MEGLHRLDAGWRHLEKHDTETERTRNLEMTPEQALQVIDQVCQNVPGTRKDHETIAQAIATLAEAIKQKDCEQCPNQS